MPIPLNHSGAGTITLKAPNSGTVTFTLPSADGTSAQVLQTNGSGVLSFGTTASTPKLLTTNFTIEESGGKLIFKYGATTIASMSSTGLITSVTDIVANGTP